MKRDMDVAREILRKVSDAEGKPSWKILVSENASDSEERNVLYHVGLLESAGLLTGISSQHIGGIKVWQSLDLTWEGHDFVAATGNSEIWQETKQGLEGVGSFTFEMAKALARGFIKKKIEQHTGVQLDL